MYWRPRTLRRLFVSPHRVRSSNHAKRFGMTFETADFPKPTCRSAKRNSQAHPQERRFDAISSWRAKLRSGANNIAPTTSLISLNAIYSSTSCVIARHFPIAPETNSIVAQNARRNCLNAYRRTSFATLTTQDGNWRSKRMSVESHGLWITYGWIEVSSEGKTA